jgi:plasmid stabilization system protein ParE
MKCRVRVLTLARNDLRDAVNYLTDFGELPPKYLRESFEKFTKQAAAMPEMFPVYEHNPHYRRAVIKYDFLVFNQYNALNHLVEVYRVLHSSRNIESII